MTPVIASLVHTQQQLCAIIGPLDIFGAVENDRSIRQSIDSGVDPHQHILVALFALFGRHFATIDVLDDHCPNATGLWRLASFDPRRQPFFQTVKLVEVPERIRQQGQGHCQQPDPGQPADGRYQGDDNAESPALGFPS